MTDSPEFLAFLRSLEHPGLKTIDLSLGRMERHLAAIGNPERRLPPLIHIAGTNGKGSTIAFIRAILESAGKHCHVFTSPHLVHFRERIVVAGQELTDVALISLLTTIKKHTQEYPLTFFEANCVAAIEAFAVHPADVTLLEVGMGGRFDATNVVEKPLLSIITPVSMDHQEFLGNSLAKIAYEKAGILKPGVPAVIAPQEPEVAAIIAQVAAEVGAPIYICTQKDVDATRQRFPDLALAGDHQYINAAVALKAMDVISKTFPIPDQLIGQGLKQARWPARLQRLTRGPLVQELPGNTVLWLDGGHNEAASRILSQWMDGQPQPVAIICGMTKLKDPAAFLTPLATKAAAIYGVEIPDESYGMPLQQLSEAAANANISILPAESVAAAVNRAVNHAKTQTILICGSLYLAGHVLAKNG